MTRPARRWLGAAVTALLAAWVLAPAAVPIYDGAGQPDEPYRYVNPPPSAKSTKTPTVAHVTVPVANGANRGAYANSGEFGPQISVYVAPSSLGVPAGATSVSVTATPLAPAPPLPKDGAIVTNVYRITATAGTAQVPIVGRGAKAAVIQMRAPNGNQPGPVFEHRGTSGGWQRVPTIRSGVDIYQASHVRQLGDWALVQLAGSTATKSAGGVNGGLLAGGIAVLVLAGAILGIRLRRTRSVGT